MNDQYHQAHIGTLVVTKAGTRIERQPYCSYCYLLMSVTAKDTERLSFRYVSHLQLPQCSEKTCFIGCQKLGYSFSAFRAISSSQKKSCTYSLFVIRI